MSVIHLDFAAPAQATEVEEGFRRPDVRLWMRGDPVDVRRGIMATRYFHDLHGFRKADIRAFFRRLSREDLILLLDSVDQRMDDDGQFFFRLDKQKAFLEELVISSGDDCVHVRAKVESYPKRREKALENAKAMLQELLDRQDK